MRRLDNRGFAFSTILYGLMLLGIMIIFVIMSTMQTNRQTNKQFVNKIEDELNRYSYTNSVLEANGGSDSREYIVPIGESGWYKIELWGAAGGGTTGGYGAYTSGIIWLEENRHLYFYIGNQGGCGDANRDDAKFTFNGAGRSYGTSCNGGGATDVRISSGAWDSNLDSRIMVAAGGGGGASSGTTKGGAAGGFLGYRGRVGSDYTPAFTEVSYGKGQDGTSDNTGGGGGGYYGGVVSTGVFGGGGSSYIAGYAGSVTKGRSGADAALSTTALAEHTRADEAKANGMYNVADLNAYFLNGFMLAGVNSGAGKAKIQKVSSGDKNTPPAVYNTDFNKTYNKVRDCYSTPSYGISEIQVMYRGRNLLFNSDDAATDGNITNTLSNNCVEYSFSASMVDEVAVWHYGKGSTEDTVTRNVTDHSLYLTATDGSITYLSTGGTIKREFAETSVGLHYSPWNPIPGGSVADGVYYIQSATGDNLFLTKNGGNVQCLTFTGENNQKWTVTDLGGGYYKISSLLDMKNSYTLQISGGAESSGSSVGIAEFVGSGVGGFNWEKWRFEDAGGGTFFITSGFNTRLTASNTTYISIIGTLGTKTMSAKNPETAAAGDAAQRYKIINATF